MGTCWNVYRFDYARYLRLRPLLRSATTAAAFDALTDGADTEEVVAALANGEIAPSEARQAFLEALCCAGEPLPLDRGFPRLVMALGRRREGEEASELLSELLAGGKNLESWLLPPSGLVGFLTPQETTELALSFERLARRGSVPRLLTGSARRRGLMFHTQRLFRLLLDRDSQGDEMLSPLMELLAEAAENDEGLAAFTL